MWKVYESILPADVDLGQVADRKGLKGADGATFAYLTCQQICYLSHNSP